MQKIKELEKKVKEKEKEKKELIKTIENLLSESNQKLVSIETGEASISPIKPPPKAKAKELQAKVNLLEEEISQLKTSIAFLKQKAEEEIIENLYSFMGLKEGTNVTRTYIIMLV